MAFLPSPMSADQSCVFSILVTDESCTSKESQENPLGDSISFEDIALLGELAEPNLPLDARHEIHLPVDNAALEYRKHLRNLGLAGR